MNFLEKSMEDLYQSVHAYVSKAFNTLSDRIAQVEKRITETPMKGEKGDPGENGKSVAIEDVLPVIQSEVEKQVSQIEKPKDADPAMVASLVAESVERVVSAIPKPQDGKSVSLEDVEPVIIKEVERRHDEMMDEIIEGLDGQP
jgi:hypothetical protein